MKHKSFSLLVALVVITIMFTACPQVHETEVAELTLNKNELFLSDGETEQLIVTILPDNVNNKAVSWKSTNPEVATVDGSGLVVAMADGKATVTVTTEDGKKTATCSIYVDYRNKWVGTYEFTTISKIGHREDYEWVYIRDTVCFKGTIEKHEYEKDRLKIVFKPNATEPDFIGHSGGHLNGLIYPCVSISGNLDYPEFGADQDKGFVGYFLVDNKIYVFYDQRDEDLWAEDHTINGINYKLCKSNLLLIICTLLSLN